MKKLLEALAEKGIRLTGCTDKEIKKIAKGVGLRPSDFVERAKPCAERYTNTSGVVNDFGKTPSILLGETPEGKPDRVQGVYVRIDAIPQLIDDLQVALAEHIAGNITKRVAKGFKG